MMDPNWNPMRDDFNDLGMSTGASDGPAANFTRTPNLARSKETPSQAGLYVIGFPPHLDESALLNIFAEHGRVLKCYIKTSVKNNAKYAILRVGSMRDATHMIEKLNYRPPMNLRVYIAKSYEERQREREHHQKYSTHSLPLERPEFKTGENVSNAIHADTSASQKTGPSINVNGFVTGGAKHTESEASTTVSDSGAEEAIADLQDSDSDMKSLRSSTAFATYVKDISDIPAERKEISRPQSSTGEQQPCHRGRAWQCMCCGDVGRLRCSVCFAWYCSLECQQDDWIYHKKDCSRPPPLLVASDEKVLYHKNTFGSISNSSSHSPLDSLSVACVEKDSVTIAQEEPALAKSAGKISPVIPREVAPHVPESNPPSEDPPITVCDKRTPLIGDVKDNLRSKIDSLLEGCVYSFYINLMEDHTHFAIFIMNQEYRKKMAKLIQELPEVPVSPSVSSLVAVFSKLHGIWCRGYVVVARKDSWKVFLLDYGNKEWVTRVKPIHTQLALYAGEVLDAKLHDSPISEDSLKKVIVCDNVLKMKIVGKKKASARALLMCTETEEPIAYFILRDLIQSHETEFCTWSLQVHLLHSHDTYPESLLPPRSLAKNLAKKDEVKQRRKIYASDLSKYTIKKDASYIVTPLNVEGDGTLCVQFIDEHKKSLDALLQETCRPNTITIADLPDICKGELLCAYSDDEGAWARAEVISMNSAAVSVLFIDVGHEASIPLKNVCFFSESLMKIPIFCCKVRLAGVNVLSECIENALRSLVSVGGPVKMKVVCISPLEVILYDKKSDTILNEVYQKMNKISLNQRQFSEASSGTVAPKSANVVNSKEEELVCVFLDDFQFVTMSLGTQRIIPMHVENSQNIFVTPVAAGNIGAKVDEMINAMTVHCDKKANNFYEPKIAELCIAKYSEDDRWYRAVKLDRVNDESGYFLFVDFGNMETINYKHVHQMISAFVELPIVALHCCLSGIPKLSEAAENRLKELVMTSQFLEAVVKRNNDPETCAYSIELPEICAQLRSERLLD